jgi:hypothetical protein
MSANYDGVCASVFLALALIAMACDAPAFFVGAFAGAGTWTLLQWLTA